MILPKVQFADGDARKLAEKLKTLYEAIRRANGESNYVLAPADPERLVQLTEAALLAQINTDIDITGKGNLLYYAGEETIEHLGYLYGARGERLQPTAAVATIRYTLSTARNVSTTIPAGYRVTPDNKLFFATEEQLIIPAYEISGDVRAKCLTEGVIGNDFEIGTIVNIVDRSPFVASAQNITVSGGGSDLEPIEEYRARIQLLPESFSVAGPDGAYQFWAMTANAEIVDVAVYMPPLDLVFFTQFLTEIYRSVGIMTEVTPQAAENWRDRFYDIYRDTGTGPGNVNIVPLMRGGEVPSDEVIQEVSDVLNDKIRRPLTDWVHILKPAVSDYTIDFDYWIRRDDAVYSGEIQSAVDIAVKTYIEWQSAKLGRDIVPDELIRLLKEAGVKRTNIRQPVYKVLEHNEVAALIGDPIINYGGLEVE